MNVVLKRLTALDRLVKLLFEAMRDVIMNIFH